jgi:hypothetical protein
VFGKDRSTLGVLVPLSCGSGRRDRSWAEPHAKSITSLRTREELNVGQDALFRPAVPTCSGNLPPARSSSNPSPILVKVITSQMT